MTQRWGFQGPVRILVTGALLRARAEITVREGDGDSSWDGFLYTDIHSKAVLIARDPSPRIELYMNSMDAEETFPFTAVLAEGKKRLHITGSGPLPTGQEDGQ